MSVCMSILGFGFGKGKGRAERRAEWSGIGIEGSTGCVRAL